MADLVFPTTPATGDIHEAVGLAWRWDGEKWKFAPGVVPRGPMGLPGESGASAYTRTTAAFNVPGIGSNMLIPMADTRWMSAGLPLFIGGFFYTVITVNPTSAVVRRES